MIRSLRAKVREEQDGDRFDLVAAALFDSLSRKNVKAIIDAGGAYVNKRRVAVAKYAVHAGDVLEVYWDDRQAAPERTGRAPSLVEGPRAKFVRPPPPALLCEEHLRLVTDDFLVVDKPAGLPSQATLVSSTDTVLHALAALHSKEFPLESLFLVHRLDKETSGLMIVARSKAVRDYFEAAFRERRVKKGYHALAFFEPREKEGVIDFPLAKDPQRPNTYFALTRPKGRNDAKGALTRYRVLKSFPASKACFVECAPETGRTHQIRVHMQALGCPLLGDKTYARNIVGHPLAPLALRHMLHAARLEFVGPRGDTYTLDAPHPADFAACLAALEARG